MNGARAQISAIAWAQMRTMRNHLPRTSVGTVLVWLVSIAWYGLYAGLGVLLVLGLPRIALPHLRDYMPIGLLGVLAFWQLVPLLTMSTGWSLQLNKLQIYPISATALFAIEVLLRLTTAPEMILILLGAIVGLFRHPDLAGPWPLWLLLYIPLNLFLSLTIREFFLNLVVRRRRFRELFAIVIILVSVLPQFLANTGLGRKALPYVLAVGRGDWTPWRDISNLSTGIVSLQPIAAILVWTILFYALARRQFVRSLRYEESFAGGAVAAGGGHDQRASSGARLSDLPSRFFQDPLAAILQKELESLPRMPRFRVIFGMACFLGMVVFVPMTLRERTGGFMSRNLLPVVNLYGLLILGDVLLWNVFGFDRGAAQLYFVTPVRFETVLKAKNTIAVIFIIMQTLLVWIIAALVRIPITALSFANAAAASAVVGIFFMCIGNYSSIAIARPVDPAQTFRKQAGGKTQMFVLLSALGMLVLVGLAVLARWAFHTDWAILAVLILEFGIGFLMYRLSTESAVERALRDREKMIDALTKGASPIGLGL